MEVEPLKTLALVNGDLVVGQGGHATVSGASKIRQMIALALGEYFGNDRFHPTQWGSNVIDQIGKPIDFMVQADVELEISRVMAQYIAIQDAEIYQDYLNGRRSRFAAADIIRNVTNIDVTVNMDSINVALSLVTLAGSSIDLNRTVAL